MKIGKDGVTMTSKNVPKTKIYRCILELLEKSPLSRAGLIAGCERRLGIDESSASTEVDSIQGIVRGRTGAIINEMHAKGLIGIDERGLYYLVSDRPVIIRIDKCEKEIIKALSEADRTKSELKGLLQRALGTDKTVTTRDDDTLSTYMGQILKRMLSDGIIIFVNNTYKLSPRISAVADDVNAMLTLKTEFLRKLHSRGGEFFEYFFMNLLKKYSEKHEKKVLECYVTGGSADGGIDGVIKTEDSLGFREITMVQTKNRVEIAGETDVRGFYGAVCAKRGTRGIFATTSDFHSGAKAFLDALDDCIGVNGDRVFKMAVECGYGIKRHNGVLEIDDKTV